MGGHHKHKKKCDCEWQKEECHECAPKKICECEKCSEPKKEHCCKQEEKCCPEVIVGPPGPRGPRGPGPITLPHDFEELIATRVLAPGMTVVLSVTLNSTVTRDIRVIAAASPNSVAEGDPIQMIFNIRLDGVAQPNGAGVTLNRDVVGREQRESIGLVRRHGPFPPGPRTIDLIVFVNNAGSQLDPQVGGATLLVEQIPV